MCTLLPALCIANNVNSLCVIINCIALPPLPLLTHAVGENDEVSIRDVALMVAKAMNFEGQVIVSSPCLGARFMYMYMHTHVGYKY